MSETVEVAKGFVLLLAGIPIYVALEWWQARRSPTPPLPPGEPPLVNGVAPAHAEAREMGGVS